MTMHARFMPLIIPALLLGGCGRSEPVGNIASEEIANAAQAAASEARNVTEAEAETAAQRNYVNSLRGFSITMPEGWTRTAASSNENGTVYEDAGAGADIRVFWSPNESDKDLQQIVEGMSEGAEAVDGDFSGTNEYRGTANDGEGNSVAVRLIRKPDGSLVTATFVFPEMLAEQYLSIGQKTLDTLKIFDAEAPGAADNGVTPAGNAADAD
jgi:hypothetical protein